MTIEKVGVIGFGTMGSGIAQVCAESGYQVIVSATSEEKVERGLASIEKALVKNVEKGKLTPEDKKSILNKIKGTVSASNFSSFSECDLIIEAVTEDINIKRRVFAEIDNVCPSHTIFATNTSTLSVIDLAKVTNRPEKVMGMHFFSPVTVMQLVEIVKTLVTSEDTVKLGQNFVKSLGKTSIVAPDIPGLLANRLIATFYLSAIRMLESNIASAQDIDTAMRLGYNHPMGPLAVLDLIGLDVFLKAVNSIYEGTNDPIYAPPTLLKKMVAAGFLGRKTGRGFHIYK